MYQSIYLSITMFLIYRQVFYHLCKSELSMLYRQILISNKLVSKILIILIKYYQRWNHYISIEMTRKYMDYLYTTF